MSGNAKFWLIVVGLLIGTHFVGGLYKSTQTSAAAVACAQAGKDFYATLSSWSCK